jgi:hypothetical protein
MWYSIAQSGLASAGVDFTDSLSLLVAGLVSLVWLSAGLIAVLAVQHHWSQPQPQMRLSEATADAVDHQEGAHQEVGDHAARAVSST